MFALQFKDMKLERKALLAWFFDLCFLLRNGRSGACTAYQYNKVEMKINIPYLQGQALHRFSKMMCFVMKNKNSVK